MLSANLYGTGLNFPKGNRATSRKQTLFEAQRPLTPPSTKSSGRSVEATSLLRALAILELIAHKSGGLTNAEISRRL